GRPEPRPMINLSARVQQILSDASNVQAIHLAPSSYDMQLALVRALAAQGKMISLDPGHYVKGLRPERLADLLKHVTIFAPSEREVYEFRGECSLEQAANDFAAMGAAIVVIKVGPRGALVLRRDTGKLERVPAFPSRTLDPTGCGDSFCSGFLAGYWETGDALQAARYGTVSASYTVEGFGVNYALRFTRQDAEQRLAALQRNLSTA
ncbi:MAG TPA: carbohydrate kinase family protein, partial [Anaerolineae bacterium]|nr:carbohydrate kinase family protein [Anaerolineae bacterium]